VASKFPAVGAVVPWAQAAIGAVATQSYANTSFGPGGLRLMQEGLSAQEALDKLLADDPQREHRQVGIIDGKGQPATFTGKECFDWAGGITGSGYAIQGNILAGEAVVQAMKAAFEASQGKELPERLYAALLAGDRAGGDRRGRQSAAIYVAKPGAGYGGFSDRWIDYRVDDHHDPVTRLGELLEMHQLYFGQSTPEDRIELAGEPLSALQHIMQKEGYYHGGLADQYDEATRSALRAFVGNENFEERTDFEKGLIDRPVYEFLLKRFGEAR
jgi:uncharacterized Ntn-hydrolase superfamily protein